MRKTTDNNTITTAPKRAFLFGARFLLAGLLIFIAVQVAFNLFTASNVFYRTLVNGVRTQSGELSSEVLEKITLKENTSGNDIYYDKADFPTGITWGSVWAHITIDGTDITDAPVYCGDSSDLLNLGICKYFGAPFPGEGGNVVLSAHVMQQFYCLEDLPVGTRIRLDTFYGTYEYEIYDSVIFSDDDTSYVLAEPAEERLTMYTCYPRGYSYRSQRYAVLCKKVSGVNWR